VTPDPEVDCADTDGELNGELVADKTSLVAVLLLSDVLAADVVLPNPIHTYPPISVIVVPETVIPDPGTKVCPPIITSLSEVEATAVPPTLVTGTNETPTARTEEELPIARTVFEPEVCSAIIVVEVPEPRVMVEPGARVWLEIMYREAEFWVIAWVPTVSTGA
jgi:hypothetical protein